MINKYPVNFYLRMPLNDLKHYLTPEFAGYLRAVFQSPDLDNVVIEYANGNEVIFHYKGEK